MIKTNKMLKMEIREDGKTCQLRFLRTDVGEDFLEFPSEQLDELIEILLQVQRDNLAKVETSQKPRTILVSHGVELSRDAEGKNIIFNFGVGPRRFVFALSRDHAVRMKEILQKI